jgi:hypothetical protein
VVVADVERMQLQHQRAVNQHLLVFVATVTAVGPEHLSVEAAGGGHVGDGDQGMSVHHVRPLQEFAYAYTYSRARSSLSTPADRPTVANVCR